MKLDDYQTRALITAIHHPDEQMDKTIWALGIAGESGELADKWKKIVAYQGGKISEDDLAEIKKEIGDVLWYLALFAHSLGLSLEDVAELNLKKLADRKTRGVQKGQGDNR